jgi:ribonuclease Z
MNKAFIPENTLKVEVKEVSDGKFFESKDFYLEAIGLRHGTPCLGYNFVEKDRRRIHVSKIKKLGMKPGPLLGKLQSGKSIKWKNKTVNPEDVTYVVRGKKISFIADTLLCDACIKLAENADILICEATFASDLEDKAKEYKHLTARQAGLIANRAGAKKLVITHFSQRYKNTQEVEEDARDVFDNVVSAQDFMKLRL